MRLGDSVENLSRQPLENIFRETTHLLWREHEILRERFDNLHGISHVGYEWHSNEKPNKNGDKKQRFTEIRIVSPRDRNEREDDAGESGQ